MDIFPHPEMPVSAINRFLGKKKVFSPEIPLPFLYMYEIPCTSIAFSTLDAKLSFPVSEKEAVSFKLFFPTTHLPLYQGIQIFSWHTQNNSLTLDNSFPIVRNAN